MLVADQATGFVVVILAAAVEVVVGIRVVAQLLPCLIAPIVHIPRQLLAPRNTPHERQQAVQAERCDECQRFATHPYRVGVDLQVDGLLAVQYHHPHKEALGDSCGIVGVFGYGMVLTPPHEGLQADKDQRQGNEKAVDEVDGTMPRHDEQHDGVVEGQNPSDAIGMRQAREQRERQRPGSDLQGSQHSHADDVGAGRAELDLLLPHGQAQANRCERREHGRPEQWDRRCGRRRSAGPMDDGMQLDECAWSALEEGL
mmetsp:Transcript_53038/g.123317  ORF Transcript_53038/g.123317 Transcript_53038/m.123317 type:complete len:257 (-) Transcript_53038:36-806(-)